MIALTFDVARLQQIRREHGAHGVGAERRAPVGCRRARPWLVGGAVARPSARDGPVADDPVRTVRPGSRRAERVPDHVARQWGWGAEILTTSNEPLPMLVSANGVPGSNIQTVPACCCGKSLTALPIVMRTSPLAASTKSVGPAFCAAALRSSPSRSTRNVVARTYVLSLDRTMVARSVRGAGGGLIAASPRRRTEMNA